MKKRALFLALLLVHASIFAAARAELAPDDCTLEELGTTVTQAELTGEDAAMDSLSQDDTLAFSEKIDRVLKRYQTLGACIVIIENGEITFTHCYGVAQIGGENVTPETGFRVGSIGKMVAGVGLMQLVERKKISLETEVGDLLGFTLRNPAYPDVPVTLRQLLCHTASLRDNGYYQDALYGDVQPLSRLFSGERTQYTFYQGYKPGSRRQYSNFGGGIVGSLIEALSGQTIDDYLTENVFAPLGITAGYQVSLLPESMPLADMYLMPERRLKKSLRDDATHITTPDPEHNYFLTAGKLTITAPDLAKILIALCDGGIYEDVRLLKESTVAEMTTRQNHRGSVTCESGHGLMLNIITDDQVEGRTMYGHGGKANGMLCAAYFDPTDRTGVIMLTNGCQNRSAHNGVGMLGRAVMRVCYAEMIEKSHTTEDPFLVGDE